MLCLTTTPKPVFALIAKSDFLSIYLPLWKRLCILGALAFGLALSPAHAAVILIDFGKTGQQTSVVSGNTWNNSAVLSSVQAPDITNLKNTGGFDTFINLTITRPSGSQLNIGSSDVTGLATQPTPNSIEYPQSATRDQAFNAAYDPATLTLSGLDNSRTYNLTFYGLTPSSGGTRYSDVTIGGITQTYDSGVVGGGWTTFSNIAPTSGDIVIGIKRGATGVGSALGVMEIASVVVPEPGTASLFLLGVACFMLARARLRRLT